MRSGARLGVIFTLFIMLAGSPAGLVAEGMVGPASSSPPAEDGGAPVAVNGDEAEPGTPVAGAHLAEEEDNGSFTHMPFDGRYQNYYTYDTLSIELQELAAEYSDICVLYDIAKWTERGSTWGGRAVWAMKISDDPGFDDPDEDEVLIIGNHHAREWMSFEVPMYLIHYLLTNYGVEPADNDGDGLLSEDPLNGMDDDGDGLIDEDWNEAQATWLVENREIWVVPMLNPDGTIYDQELSEPGGAGGRGGRTYGTTTSTAGSTPATTAWTSIATSLFTGTSPWEWRGARWTATSPPPTFTGGRRTTTTTTATPSSPPPSSVWTSTTPDARIISTTTSTRTPGTASTTTTTA